MTDIWCRIEKHEWWPVLEPRGTRDATYYEWETPFVPVPLDVIKRYLRAKREFFAAEEELGKYEAEGERLRREERQRDMDARGIVVGIDGFILEPRKVQA